jgi:hypothetical protein
MNDELLQQERASCQRFGWTSLCVWAALGLGLEGAQGWKLSAYLDDELTRQLLRLGHAHGVLLAVVVLVYASAGLGLFVQQPDAARAVRRGLCAAALLLPVGFVLGALGHSETDPGVGIWLVPVGALCLLGSLLALALASWRRR